MDTEKNISPGLKFLLELGPVALFVLSYNRPEWFSALSGQFELLSRPIFMATAVFMVAMVVALAASWLLMRTLPVMPLVTLFVVLVFGGLTLYLTWADFGETARSSGLTLSQQFKEYPELLTARRFWGTWIAWRRSGR